MEALSMSPTRTLLPPARVLVSLVFLVSGTLKLTHWGRTASLMAAHGLPMVQWLLFGAVAVEVLGGLSVMLGIQTRIGALVLFAYLIPVTLVFHAFWRLTGLEAQMQAVNFLKNLSIMGGLVALSVATPSATRSRATAARRGHELPSTHSTSAA
jgi:putative oxidoreductase